MRTCRQIAQEMRGLALRVNTITFKTTPESSENTRRTAAIYDILVEQLDSEKAFMLVRLDSLLMLENTETLLSRHPTFPIFHERWTERLELTSEQRRHRCRGEEAPSLVRDFIHSTLGTFSAPISVLNEIMSKSTQRYRMIFHKPCTPPDYDAFRHLDPEPWSIPDDNDNSRLVIAMGSKTKPFKSSDSSIWENNALGDAKVTFSAASTCVKFLRSLPDTLLNDVRKIVLQEDCPSAAYSACHGRAFIPFCRRNPLLTIERRTNHWDFHINIPELGQCELRHSIGDWIREGLALPSLGMPAGSFALFIENGRSPESPALPVQVNSGLCKVPDHPFWRNLVKGEFTGCLDMRNSKVGSSMRYPLLGWY